jgi:TonB family protein
MLSKSYILEIDKAAPAKRNARAVVLMLLAAFLFTHTAGYAQEVRKAKSNPPPEYPELAKRLNIRGVARVRVTITPDGAVKEVRELGGNPVLVEALAHAVKKWKYEPADKTSVLEVKFDFQP